MDSGERAASGQERGGGHGQEGSETLIGLDRPTKARGGHGNYERMQVL